MTVAVTAVPLTTVREQALPAVGIIIASPTLQTIETGRIQVISTIEPEHSTQTIVAGCHRIERHPPGAARTPTRARRFVSVTEATIMVHRVHGRLRHGQRRDRRPIVRIHVDQHRMPQEPSPDHPSTRAELPRSIKRIVRLRPRTAVSQTIGNNV